MYITNYLDASVDISRYFAIVANACYVLKNGSRARPGKVWELWALPDPVTGPLRMDKHCVLAALLLPDHHQFYALTQVVFPRFYDHEHYLINYYIFLRCSVALNQIPDNYTELTSCSLRVYDADVSSYRETKCNAWDFERESGYESITTEVTSAQKYETSLMAKQSFSKY